MLISQMIIGFRNKYPAIFVVQPTRNHLEINPRFNGITAEKMPQAMVGIVCET